MRYLQENVYNCKIQCYLKLVRYTVLKIAYFSYLNNTKYKWRVKQKIHKRTQGDKSFASGNESKRQSEGDVEWKGKHKDLQCIMYMWQILKMNVSLIYHTHELNNIIRMVTKMG